MNKITFKNEKIKLDFHISIIKYQFPEIIGDYDGNWLTLKYECQYKDKSFSVVDPSLLTTELKQISNWFYSISKNNIPEYVSLCFLEPNLEFNLHAHKNGVVRIGIKLDAEAKPPFKIDEFILSGFEDEEYDFEMIFDLSFDELNKYSKSFAKLCEKFPQRGSL